MALHGDTEFGVEEIVAHGVVLSVIPERRHGVAVVIAHGQILTGGAEGRSRMGSGAGEC